jgi:hypothetical protein
MGLPADAFDPIDTSSDDVARVYAGETSRAQVAQRFGVPIDVVGLLGGSLC